MAVRGLWQSSCFSPCSRAAPRRSGGELAFKSWGLLPVGFTGLWWEVSGAATAGCLATSVLPMSELLRPGEGETEVLDTVGL